MEEKSTYNMIISIISSVIVVVMIVLGIIFQAFKRNTLGIIFESIFYTSLLVYFILNSIKYGTYNDNKRSVLDRISTSFLYLSTSLITIYIVLLLNNPCKWILFSTICIITLLLIVFSSTNLFKIIRYLLSGILVFTNIFVLINLNINMSLEYITIISILLLYLSLLLGRTLNNKIVLSLDIVSLILFGIFYILH